jgi:hypothetical protein
MDHVLYDVVCFSQRKKEREMTGQRAAERGASTEKNTMILAWIGSLSLSLSRPRGKLAMHKSAMIGESLICGIRLFLFDMDK